MGIGLVAISTNQKVDQPVQPGPPFAATSANNGLSVDPVSGKIVLGNDVADPAAPAGLLSNREILMDDAFFNMFQIILNAIQSTGVITTFTGDTVALSGPAGTLPVVSVTTTGAGSPSVQVVGAGASNPTILNQAAGAGICRITNIAGAGGIALFTNRVANEIFQIDTGGAVGAIRFGASNISVPIFFFQVETATLNTQIGPTLRPGNGAQLQVSGSLTNQRLVVGKGAGAYNVDRDTDSGTDFTNSGAAVFNVPNMAGALNRQGFILRLLIKNAAGSTIQLFAGQVGLFGAAATSAGGTYSSVTVGSSIVLVWDAANWVTESFTGVWVLT